MGWGDRLAKVYIALIILFIYLPVFFMMALSFKSGTKVSFPIEGFTLDWYIKPPTGYEYSAYISIMHDKNFFTALNNSLFVSIITALLTCLLVTTTALALRKRIVGRDMLFYLFILGFIVPGVALGLGVTFMFRLFGVESSLLVVATVLTVYTVPFGLILMMSRFDPELATYEYAASVLRASPINVFRRITLPLIIFEVISAAIMGFLLSWGEVIRTQFVMKGTGTLATYIKNELSINPITPKWFAAGTIIAIVAFIGLAIFAYIMSRRVR
ncbi:MAG: ABC transporter permease subunit [Nitrososphaerota archaeon]|nr:ABC transporter permease subunit [Aigarchaeota archaeon]MDW8076801.1 ABC transporter permease subunit [Nitrososphaerota archaeon]